MTTSPKAIVNRKQNVRTYSELWHASNAVLQKGISEPQGSSWQFMSSLILTAFAFEAYMNHVGEQVLASWDGLERLSPLAKLDLLCEVLKVDLPGGDKRPKQTLITLFKFRNTLAHGRTETIAAKPTRMRAENVDDHFGKPLMTEWQKLITNDKFAKRSREDIETLVKAIHEKRPSPKEYPFTLGFGIGSASIEPSGSPNIPRQGMDARVKPGHDDKC